MADYGGKDRTNQSKFKLIHELKQVGVLENVTSQAKLLEGILEDNKLGCKFSHFAKPL